MKNKGFDISQSAHKKKENENDKNWLSEILNKDLLPYKLKNKNKEFFYMEMHSMIEAGMDMTDALDVIITQEEKKKEKEVYQNIKERLIKGSSFYECLKESGHFTPYEYYCIMIGEETGKFSLVLKQLSDFFTKRIKLKQQIVKSLSYPLVILFSSILAVSFMLAFIIPMFTDVFKRFGGDLPAITKFFIKLSDVLRHNFIPGFIIALIIGVSLGLVWKKVGFQKKRQRIISLIPYFGDFVLEVHLARFCSSMALLISAKVPLVTSINLVSKMIDFYPVKNPLQAVEKGLMKGIALHKGLSEFDVFDPKMIALIKVGEEVNSLDVFFNKLSHNYTNNVDMKATALNTFLEPLIIGVLGGVIGLILVSMYLPMFKLSTSIG